MSTVKMQRNKNKNAPSNFILTHCDIGVLQIYPKDVHFPGDKRIGMKHSVFLDKT